MNKEDKKKKKKKITHEQNMKIMSYPDYFRATLIEAAERGESIEEVAEKLDIFNYMM